jgi:regulator of sirC expression with transglutaminase-like and TPR domain
MTRRDDGHRDDDDDDPGAGGGAGGDLVEVAVEARAFDDASEDFDLLRAAALLARVEGRDADVAGVVAAVEGWAAQVAERVRHAGPLVALHDVLFATAGLRGDVGEYDAPRNSFLDDVVRRRRGLPIALSVLVIEVARRAGVRAWGLALPSHFCCAVFVDDERFAVVDAFEGGRLLPPAEIARRVGLPESELPELLQPAPPTLILRRMLTNLRGSYLRRGQHEPLCRVVSRLLLLTGRDPALLLERAELRRLLLDDDGARADAAAARAAAPRDDDVARAVAHLLQELDTRVVH